MELYNLGKDIIAFTTDRTQGRDMDKIRETIIGHYPALQGRIKSGLYPHQTHTDRVFHVTEDFLALSEEERKARLEGIDAVISKVKDVIFGISTADCIPVLVYDPEHHAAAAIHAGWKGTVKRIVEKSLRQMQETFGTDPAKCTAAIGPGISLESFEVGDELARGHAARHTADELGAAFHTVRRALDELKAVRHALGRAELCFEHLAEGVARVLKHVAVMRATLVPSSSAISTV